MANGKMAQRANFEVKQMGSINKVAQRYGVNPSMVWRVLHGGNSPTLRRIWKIPKHEPRPRLCIDCHPALIERFDDMRKGRGRAELLCDLMDLADGLGQLEV